jgi:hypothetical protein
MSEHTKLTDDGWRELTAEEYILRNMPEKYGEIARAIDRTMAFDAEVPPSLCRCDEASRCVAHNAAFDYAQDNQPKKLARFLRLVERWRAAK